MHLPWLESPSAEPPEMPQFDIPDGAIMEINYCYQRNVFLYYHPVTKKGDCVISPPAKTAEVREAYIEPFKNNTSWTMRQCYDIDSFLSLANICVERIKPGDYPRWRLKTVIEMVYMWPENFMCGNQSMLDILAPLEIDEKAFKCTTLHGFCPIQIQPREVYQGLPNDHWLTVSSCECDRAFYTCLSAANTFSSKLILYLYFNLFQAQDRCIYIQKGKREKLKIVNNPRTIEPYEYPFYDTVEDMCKYAITLRKAQDVTFDSDALYGEYTLLTEGVDDEIGFVIVSGEDQQAGYDLASSILAQEKIHRASRVTSRRADITQTVILKEYPKPKKYRYTEEL